MLAALSELDSDSEEERKNCIITATRRGFSNSSRNEESEFNDYVIDNEDFKLFFRPKFYANGDCVENENCVSILFSGSDTLTVFPFTARFEVNFTVAVIDAAGNKRFRQTSSYFSELNSSCDLKDQFASFGLERYLKRETLCNEPSELLPDDCLTVYLEIDFSVNFDRGKEHSVFNDEEIVYRNGLCYVNLDSTFGRELRQVSDFFKSASDTPMKESETRLVCIPDEDFQALNRIQLELKGAKAIQFESVEDACDMYTVADKYCIQSVVETSRQIIKSFLCSVNDKTIVEHVVKSIPVLLELAEKHNDENFKGMISLYLEAKNKFEEERKQFLHVFEEHMKEKLVTDWTCERLTFDDYNFFRLNRMRYNVKEPGIEFYK